MATFATERAIMERSLVSMKPFWRAAAGEPAYVRQVEARIKKQAVGKPVELVGHVPGVDKAYLLQHADWFVLPSKGESFGVTE
jgi:glycosyltransferase involved in cell wall biosynthesis